MTEPAPEVMTLSSYLDKLSGQRVICYLLNGTTRTGYLDGYDGEALFLRLTGPSCCTIALLKQALISVSPVDSG